MSVVDNFLNNVKEDLKKAINITYTEDSNFLDKIQDIFREFLIEKGIVKDEKEYYNLLEVMYYQKEKDMYDDLEELDSVPVMEAEDRQNIKGLKFFDMRQVEGYYPYVEKKGVELDERQQKILKILITEFDIFENIEKEYDKKNEDERLEGVLLYMKDYFEFIIERLPKDFNFQLDQEKFLFKIKEQFNVFLREHIKEEKQERNADIISLSKSSKK